MTLLLGLLAVILVGFSFGGTGTGSTLPARTTAASRVAVVRFASIEPLAVRGTHFVPRERVRVRVVAGRKSFIRVVTARRGSFTATFATSIDPCLGATAVAVGNRGSRAVTKLVFRDCPPVERLSGRSP
jgi:hypothetical protein